MPPTYRRTILIALLAALAAGFAAMRWCSRPPSDQYPVGGPIFTFPFPATNGSDDGTVTLDGSSTTTPPIDEDHRPEWWLAETVVTESKVSVAMFADGASLSDAERRLTASLQAELCAHKAWSLVSERFKSEGGLLPGGRYRLFALAVADTEPE